MARVNRHHPVVYDWVGDKLAGQARRKPIEAAKKLLADAGWPDGRDGKTGKRWCSISIRRPAAWGDKSMLDWLTRQFASADIQLVVCSTDYNRFQDKIRKGAVQIFFFGWNADYPTRKTSSFCSRGAKARSRSGGENASNYDNSEV